MPGEHVAGATRRHAGVAGRIDEHPSFRRGDHRPVPLEHDIDVMRRGEVARRLDAIVLHLLHATGQSAAPSRPDAA